MDQCGNKRRSAGARRILRALAAGLCLLSLAACAGGIKGPWAGRSGATPRNAIVLYAAPDGDDANPGTAKKPLASLTGARDAVRKTLATRPGKNIVVFFRGGTYRMAGTAVFGLPDSAPDGCTVTYAAAPGETPVFTSALPITGWKKLEQRPEGLPEAARGRVWVADLPAELGSFRTLYDGAERLPRAREAGFRCTRPKLWYKPWPWSGDSNRTLAYPEGKLRNWPNLRDVELVMVGSWPWTMNILPIESLDPTTHTATLGQPSTYMLAQTNFGFEKEGIWVENTLAGLDGPGRWVLDSQARRLYLWPRGERPDGIVAPRLVELVRVEGGIDYEGPVDTPVRNLVFRGLTFTQGDRFLSHGKSGWGLQHDWERFDASTALMRLRGAEGCAVEACTFAQSGGTGLRLDLHCQRNRIRDNVISHVGGAGILLAGYGPGIKNVNKQNEVVNNTVDHVGELYWHSSGIFVWQSGENLIAHNLLHDLPYTGIVVSGRIHWTKNGEGECSRTVRWNEVGTTDGSSPWPEREKYLHGRKNRLEYNEIRDVMQVMHDGNGIYVSGTGGGIQVYRNYIHDCASTSFAEGIRCDDDQHATTVQENVILRIGGLATGICSKGKNDMINNVIALPLSPTRRGMISIETSKPDGSIIRGNILYATGIEHKFLYKGRSQGGAESPEQRIEADGNVYFNRADPRAGEEYLKAARQLGREGKSIAADPMFMDLEKGDVRLKPDSPALALGIASIDIRQAGLLKKE